ncbi:MAG TPA: thioredoxin domain-containing protein [Candidatus Binataceae bacterium]|nr:thioredoxin domain-containing protein [Candidatus Binataceae bacterium]
MMTLLRLWLAIVLSVGLVNAVWAACDGNQQVVAKVGNQTITQSQLDSVQAAHLLSQQYSYYLAERGALDQMVDQLLLQQAAAHEHLTVAQLLTRHLKGQVKEPSEDALRAFYEGMETDQPYEQLRGQILDHLRQLRAQHARDAYVRQLRANTTIITMLEPPSAAVALGKAPVRGAPGAPITLVEFADYECPYCRQINPELLKLEQRYPSQLRVAFKDMPLPMHAHAQKAAEAARCAGQQGAFWPYHDRLFVQADIDVPHLKELARKLKLNGTQFDRCLDSGSQAAAVAADQSQAKGLGLTGTPSFFINGHFVSGAVSYDTLDSLVAQQLAAKAASASGAAGNAARAATGANAGAL